MKEWRKKVKRILVLLLTAALIGNTVDFPVFAVSAAENRETGLCRHHQSHTVECGYWEEDNMPCGYECCICPMEDLIAALPGRVTEGNAEKVRAQLNKILALYRKLTAEEQEQIDLTRCYELQAALDEANAPVTATTGNVSIPAIGALDIKFTADECAGGCQGHTITQEVGTVQSLTIIIVESGTHDVTFSSLNLTSANIGVMPSATMNLTLQNANTIKGNTSGIYVPKGATLVIDGSGSLKVSASTNSGAAGIGGSLMDPSDPYGDELGDPDCGTIVVNGGIITATGATECAGIGGATCDGYYIKTPGNGGNVTINGGTVTATGGGNEYYSGAGIGGGTYSENSTKSGSGGTLTINGGNVTLTSGHSSAYGFGRGSGSNSNAGTLTLADASCLTLTNGTTLDPKGTYSINGDPTEDMIVVPTDLVYTGQTHDLTGKIYIDDSKTGTATYFEQTFNVTASADGWVLQDLGEVKEAGEYTVTFTKGGKSISTTFTVAACPHTGLVYTPQENNKHGGTCSICNTVVSEEHTWVDGTCEVCNLKAVANVEIGNATTYYGDLDPAWTAAYSAQSAVVTLLADVTETLILGVSDGEQITLNGGNHILSIVGFSVSGGQLDITGGMFEMRNGLEVSSGTVRISGGEFIRTSSGSVIFCEPDSNLTVGDFLLNHDSTDPNVTHYAYYRNGEALTGVLDQTSLAGPVTVAECKHEGVKATPNNNGTHSLNCPYCGYTEAAANCAYGTEYQHDDTNHWQTCTVCQGTTTPEAHHLRVTADEPVNGVTQNREACDDCDFTKNPFTVTVTVPSGLTYGSTVGIKPSFTISTEKTFDTVQLVLENEEGNKNWLEGDTLPDDLSAGSYKLSLTGGVSGNPMPVFLGRAYFTVAPATLTGDMVTLSPESVTYSGAAQEPAVTVKQGDTTLAEGTDYDVTYSTTDFTNAGKVTVTIKGKGNYTGTVEKTYTIKKAPLTITASSQTITYGGSITQGAGNVSDAGLCSGDRLDGITLTASTANVPGGNITPSAAGIKNSGGKDVTGNYEITYKDGGLTINKADAEITVGTGTYSKTFGDAAFTLDVTDNNTEADVQYEVTGGTDVVSVSNGTVTIQNVGTATIIVSLPETANYNAAESKTITVSVAKKDGYTVSEINKNYYYDKENAANISLTALLPPNCGTVMYGEPATSGDVTFTAVDVENGVLSYALAKGNINDEGTLTVPVTMRNYTDITVTVKVKLTEQIPVELKEGTEVTLVNNTLTYGESLSNLEFNEAVFVDNDGDTVKGTLAWKEAAAKPNAGTTSAVWVFTPDKPEYAPLEGMEAITVNKAAPTVSGMPTVADRVYNPSITLKDGDLSSITVTGVDGASLEGTWNWQSADSIPTVNNSGYEAVFTPEDTTNYEIITRTITVTVIKAVPYIAELPTAAGITYGDTLDVSALSDGTVLHGGGSGQAGNGAGITETVAGAFTWKEPSTKPVAADSNVTEYTIVFTPSDTVNYNSVEAAVKLTVNKAQNAPNMPGSVMDVSNSIEKVGNVALPEGWEWQASDKDTALEVGAAVSAVAVYTGADKGNYENETVTVAITRSSCDHVAGDVLYTGEGEKEPTCTGEGLGHRECTKCGSVVESGIVVPTLGHHYKSEVTTEPTTDREGIRTYTCSRCGEQYRESIPKLTDSTEKTVSLTKVKIKGMASEKKKQLTVSWNPVEGADGYEVIYASDKSFTKNKMTKKTTKTSLTLKKLNEKKTWYVKVRAYAKKGTETYTGKYSAARYIKLSQRPANVKKVTVKPGTKKLSVTAGSVKGATGYEIVVSTDKAGKKTVASKKAAKGKASFTKLGKKKTYYITVRAYKKTKSGGYLYSAKKVTKVKTK